jgi:hypothetical protein
MASKRDAVRAAQVKLQPADPTLVLDGWWGKRTESSYQGSEPAIQAAAVQALRDYGFTLDAVRMRGVVQRGVWLGHEKAESLAERAANKLGIEPALLLYMLKFEPSVRTGPHGLEYNVEAVAPSGLYKGLFQVGAAAWKDAAVAAPEIGSFEQNWKDPWLNAQAAAGFAVANMGYARRIHQYNGPFTPEIVYAMHNQGHSFISSARAGGIGRYADGQSGAAVASLTRAASIVKSA